MNKTLYLCMAFAAVLSLTVALSATDRNAFANAKTLGERNIVCHAK